MKRRKWDPRTKARREEMRQDVRKKLIRAAKDRRTIFFGEFIYRGNGIARGQGAPWKIGDILFEINEYEHTAGRPLLSAICVLKATRMPGCGFWEMEFIPESVRNGTEAQRREFLESEQSRVFDYWQKHNL